MDRSSVIERGVLLGFAAVCLFLCVICAIQLEWLRAPALSALCVFTMNIWMVVCFYTMLTACRQNRDLRDVLFEVLLAQTNAGARKVVWTTVAVLWLATVVFIIGISLVAFGQAQSVAGTGLMLCLLSVVILNVALGYSFVSLTHKAERLYRNGDRKEGSGK